jgi:hypothetical protein
MGDALSTCMTAPDTSDDGIQLMDLYSIEDIDVSEQFFIGEESRDDAAAAAIAAIKAT